MLPPAKIRFRFVFGAVCAINEFGIYKVTSAKTASTHGPPTLTSPRASAAQSYLDLFCGSPHQTGKCPVRFTRREGGRESSLSITSLHGRSSDGAPPPAMSEGIRPIPVTLFPDVMYRAPHTGETSFHCVASQCALPGMTPRTQRVAPRHPRAWARPRCQPRPQQAPAARPPSRCVAASFRLPPPGSPRRWSASQHLGLHSQVRQAPLRASFGFHIRPRICRPLRPQSFRRPHPRPLPAHVFKLTCQLIAHHPRPLAASRAALAPPHRLARYCAPPLLLPLPMSLLYTPSVDDSSVDQASSTCAPPRPGPHPRCPAHSPRCAPRAVSRAASPQGPAVRRSTPTRGREGSEISQPSVRKISQPSVRKVHPDARARSVSRAAPAGGGAAYAGRRHNVRVRTPPEVVNQLPALPPLAQGGRGDLSHRRTAPLPSCAIGEASLPPPLPY